MQTNRYGALASRVYELDKPVGHSFGDVEFYLALLRDVPGAILEPAVGTGRVLIPLLRAGLDVDGFDASPEMLAICRRTCEAAGVAPRLSQASFEDFSPEREYAAIILPAGSFQLITSFESALAVLKRFHAISQRQAACSSTSASPAQSTEPPPASGTGTTPPATSSPCTKPRRPWTTWPRSPQSTSATTYGATAR